LAFIFPFLNFSSYYFLPGPPYWNVDILRLSLSLCNGCGGRIERESITKMLWRRAIFSLYLTPFTSVSVV
jgi:hypothetical protein